MYVECYLWLSICYLLSESFYLKLAITCKNLFPFASVVRLVIFSFLRGQLAPPTIWGLILSTKVLLLFVWLMIILRVLSAHILHFLLPRYIIVRKSLRGMQPNASYLPGRYRYRASLLILTLTFTIKGVPEKYVSHKFEKHTRLKKHIALNLWNWQICQLTTCLAMAQDPICTAKKIVKKVHYDQVKSQLAFIESQRRDWDFVSQSPTLRSRLRDSISLKIKTML